MIDTLMLADAPAPPDRWPERLLLQVWGEQACQRPADWPDVLARLLKDGTATPGNGDEGRRPRASMKPAVDAAVAALAAGFGADTAPPADPPLAVWRAFPKLDKAHCARLAALLIEARTMAPAPSRRRSPDRPAAMPPPSATERREDRE